MSKLCSLFYRFHAACFIIVFCSWPAVSSKKNKNDADHGRLVVFFTLVFSV